MSPGCAGHVIRGGHVTSGAPGESGRLLSLLAGHVDETLRARNKAGAPHSTLARLQAAVVTWSPMVT